MLYRAKWIVIDSDTIIENGFLSVEQGKIEEYGSAKNFKTKSYKDLGCGVVIPSLVNCHTHLELSALKNSISFNSGFQKWVQNLIKQRDILSSNDIDKGIKNGIEEIIESGTLSIGEISSLFRSEVLLKESVLTGVYFKEYLGNNPEISKISNIYPISTSYAGHAPHTTSPSLLKKIKSESSLKKLPFSIHLSESETEIEFITTGKGDWANFLSSRNIDFANWPVPEKSPVKYLSKLKILDKNTLCVHLTYADKNDFQILKDSESSICLCLRSNLNLHNRLPDLKTIDEMNIDFCLGTDSLASCDSLSIFDEMSFLSENYNFISPKKIFESGTINGAKAIGFDKTHGTLRPGHSGNFVFLEITENKSDKIFEKIVNSDFSKKTTVLNPDTI